MATGKPAPAIGIDLGTTFSCAAVLTETGVQVIHDNRGKTTMPSVVAFMENVRLVGDRARDRALIDPENTIDNMKRLIGRKLTDAGVKEDVDMFTFKVVNDGRGNPKVQVNHEGQDKLFRPEEISAAVLSELKTLAEEQLRQPIKDAVITVPAYFTNAQREATLDAGRIAGLNVLQTINEPTAAALTYGFDNQPERKTLLIYDFGGGTFDVSILNMTNGQAEVLSMGGHGHLGGEDIDNLLVKHLTSEFMTNYNIDLFSKARSGNAAEAKRAKTALRRLKILSEKAKIELSRKGIFSLEAFLLFDDKDLKSRITRSFLQNLCQDLIRSTLTIVEQTLESANLSKNDISEIVLVGGSTRIPLVTDLLKQLFPKTEIHDGMNPDEAVAYGAAIKAAILSGVDPELVRHLRLRDVTPMSLGIEAYGGVMARIIKRNTAVPVHRKKVFTTGRDNQTQLRIKVFEGERAVTKFNNFLGEFTLIGIPPAPKNVPQIEVDFEVDASGILTVRATDFGSEWVSEIQITNNRGRLSPREIELAVQEAARMKDKDLEYVKEVQAKERLETYANQIRHSLRTPRIRDRLDSEQLSKITEMVDEALAFHEFQRSELTDLIDKYNELYKIWVPLVTRLFHGPNYDQSNTPVLQSDDSFYQSSDSITFL